MNYCPSANSMIGSCVSLLRSTINAQPCAKMDEESHKFCDRVLKNPTSIDFPLISTPLTGMNALNQVII